MRKWSSRERLFLNVTAGFFVLLAIDRVIVAPLWQSWKEINSAVEKKRAQIADDRRLIAESDEIRRAYAVSFPSRSSKDQARGGEMTSLLREIETLARQSGIKIRDIKPQSTLNQSNKNKSVFVSMESSWNTLAQFIYAVQRSPQLLQIQKADLHRNGDDESRLLGQFMISDTRGVNF